MALNALRVAPLPLRQSTARLGRALFSSGGKVDATSASPPGTRLQRSHLTLHAVESRPCVFFVVPFADAAQDQKATRPPATIDEFIEKAAHVQEFVKERAAKAALEPFPGYAAGTALALAIQPCATLAYIIARALQVWRNPSWTVVRVLCFVSCL